MFARAKEKERESNNRMEREAVKLGEVVGGESYCISLLTGHNCIDPTDCLFFPESERFTGRHYRLNRFDTVKIRRVATFAPG